MLLPTTPTFEILLSNTNTHARAQTKSKADKHRQEMHLFFLKQTHQQRQETAQLKREEKERSLQEKMMNEEDPEKQRRMDVSFVVVVALVAVTRQTVTIRAF